MNGLAARTILGFAQLLVVLGLALFAPAWTLRFWQAWVYLAVFAVSAALITAYLWKRDRPLLERRVHAGPAAERRPTRILIQTVAGVAFLGVFVVSSLDHRLAWSHLPVAVVLAGDALAALGFLIVFFVFKENSFASGTIELTADQPVISTGPYGLVRHPMYLGGLVLLFGTPLALGSLPALALFVPIAAVIVARLLDEERLLTHGLAGYEDYRRKVRYRLAPMLW